MPDDDSIGQKLKAMRKRARLSVRDLAEKLEMPPSTYASYEDKFKKPFIPLPLARKMVNAYSGLGVERDEILALAGVGGLGEPGESPPKHVVAAEIRMAAVEELDVTAAAGDGADVEQGHVLRTWLMPRDIVSIATDSALNAVKIIRIKGDSMTPSFHPLDRVLVDTGDTLPSPGGIFVVWDGLGLVVKRVQVVPHTDPPRVKITSDNPKYEPYERALGVAYIQGRVIGKWLWT